METKVEIPYRDFYIFTREFSRNVWIIANHHDMRGRTQKALDFIPQNQYDQILRMNLRAAKKTLLKSNHQFFC